MPKDKQERALSDLTFDEFQRHCGGWSKLRPQDHTMVKAFWETLQRYTEVSGLLDELTIANWTTLTSTGNRVPVPEIAIQKTLHAQLKDFAVMFGFSPSNRLKEPPDFPGTVSPASEVPSTFSSRKEFAEAIYK